MIWALYYCDKLALVMIYNIYVDVLAIVILQRSNIRIYMWGWDSWGRPQQSQFFIGLLGNSVSHYCFRQKNVTLAVKCCIYQFTFFLG